MQTQWPQLKQFEYPGRFIIIGRTAESYYAIYGVTARSESSRAKRYIFDRTTNTIKVEATDDEVMAKGNLDLLSYNAARIFKNSLVVGNGQQTDLIKMDDSAVDSLMTNLNTQTFEPDNHRTPRITGMIVNDGNKVSAALYIIKANENGETEHGAYDLDLKPGQAYFISTYAGKNIKPTPSFTNDPILLEIDFQNCEDAAAQLYNRFAPPPNKPDLRVSVIAIETNLTLEEKNIAIINYHK